MKLFYFILFSTSFLVLHAQEVTVSFDNCLAINQGSLADPEINGSTSCDCGVSGESLFFEDPTSSLNFNSSYTSIFQQSFSLSFNFMISESQSDIIDIFSVASKCQVDSSLTIKYIPQESSIRIQMAASFDLFIELKAPINNDQCWHSLVFQRDDRNYNLFIDGKFADTDFVNGNIKLDSSATMQFSDSPCLSFGDSPFVGKIDEFKIYSRVLSAEEIFSNYIPFDQILTMDTTIFTGNSLTINHTKSCADLVSWFPSKNVTQSTIIEPTIAPEETTLYRVNYDYGICAGQDSIRISIIDEDAVECDNLLIPNAFTPNNDGLNDFIGISNAFIIEELRSFEIFDRWGEMVFSTVLKTDQWDGSLLEQLVNSNIFLYKVNYSCKGDDFIKTGSFSILR